MLDGFTLFQGSRGWQLSTREKGEQGFSIHYISDARAGELLVKLEQVLEVAQAGKVQHQINDFPKRQRARLDDDDPPKRQRSRL